MQKQHFKKAFALLAVLLTNCAVKPPNVLVCTEISVSEGYCVETLTGHDLEISEKKPHDFGDGKPLTWWDMRPTTVVMPYQSWVELKKFVVDSCKFADCDSAVNSWDRSIKALDSEVENKLP